MDLAKYISLLKSESIYFPKITLMEDQWEGATPALERIGLWRDAPWNHPLEREHELYIPHPTDEIESLRNEFYVSCWHENEFESTAMWKLYSSSHESLAVVTDSKKLQNFVPKWIKKGSVRYIDYKTGHIGSSSPYERFYCKRKSFSHEKEYRLVAWKNHPKFQSAFGSIDRVGITIKIPLNKVIEKVVVNPNSPHWYLDVIRDLSDRYGLNAEIYQSELNDTALF